MPQEGGITTQGHSPGDALTYTHARHSRNRSQGNENIHTSNKLAEPANRVCMFVYVNRDLCWYGMRPRCHCMWLLNTCQVVNTPCPVPNHRCRFNQPSVRLKNKSWRSIPVWLHSLIIVWSSNSEMTKRDGPSGCYECNYILTINRPVPQRSLLYDDVPGRF